MAKSIHRVTTLIREIENVSADVCQLTLMDPDGWELPPFTPGAHLDVNLPSGRIRQYSLCNCPTERRHYKIAIKKDPAGRGGSIEIHDLKIGQELLVSLPRNLFELAVDAPVVFVAGGIGITPFFSALPKLIEENPKFTLHVAAPNPEMTPFFADLSKVEQVTFHHSQLGSRLDIATLLENTDPAVPIYCCGPTGMLTDLQEEASRKGHTVTIEHFGQNADPGQLAYEVEIASSGAVIPVSAGQTMLDALRLAEVEIPASCEGGICLECKTRYIKGTAEHRDILLTTEDRREYLTPCVSGCQGDRITLDL